MSTIHAIIIAIVEGLTEFLPISSTGHMVITSSLLGIAENDFTKLFEVSIQLGAIMAVVIYYWKKFIDFTRWQFYLKLLIGVIPALLLGLIFNKQIDKLLEKPLPIAIATLLGGIILFFVDGWFKNQTVESDDQISYPKAFTIGCWQVLAMIPGTSRSAASIIGGMQQKLTRNLAAEFSFFLAVPTMFAATAYSLFLKKWGALGGVTGTGNLGGKKGYQLILESHQNTYSFIIGNLVAFAVALLAIRFFINYLKIYGFKVFGIYRIILGTILLVLILTGHI